jgi:hypothetical protein
VIELAELSRIRGDTRGEGGAHVTNRLDVASSKRSPADAELAGPVGALRPVADFVAMLFFGGLGIILFVALAKHSWLETHTKRKDVMHDLATEALD